MYGPILGLLNSKIRNVSLNFEIKELVYLSSVIQFIYQRGKLSKENHI